VYDQCDHKIFTVFGSPKILTYFPIFLKVKYFSVDILGPYVCTNVVVETFGVLIDNSNW